MNNISFEYPEGATPLTNDELYELIPRHVTSQGELNSVEQMNVAKGLLWLARTKPTMEHILDEIFIRKLHVQLFGDVWRWAGRFRKTDKNIGIDWLQIPIALRKLVDDTRFQITHNSYPGDELGVRFHHRLVLIHPFPNGNGRHARIITDQLLKALSVEQFTWGGNNIQNYSYQTEARRSYISALRQADKGDFDNLLKFVREKYE